MVVPRGFVVITAEVNQLPTLGLIQSQGTKLCFLQNLPVPPPHNFCHHSCLLSPCLPQAVTCNSPPGRQWLAFARVRGGCRGAIWLWSFGFVQWLHGCLARVPNANPGLLPPGHNIVGLHKAFQPVYWLRHATFENSLGHRINGKRGPSGAVPGKASQSILLLCHGFTCNLMGLAGPMLLNVFRDRVWPPPAEA